MEMDGGPMEICFSLDTNYNIAFCLQNVTAKVILLIQKLHAKIPGVRIAIFAHGDYCKIPYTTKHIDFSTNVHDLCEWINSNKMTAGRDVDAYYELVLKEVQSLSWTPGSKRVLVMIGNSDPHEPGYTCGPHTCTIDWKDEATKLMQMDIKVYGTQWECRSPKDFYEKISVSTGGKCVPCYQFDDLFETLREMCYLNHDNPMLQREVHCRGCTIHDIGSLCKGLRRADTIEIDTVSSSPMTKHASIKVLGPSSKPTVKTTKKIHITRSNAKRKRVMVDKELVEKYKLRKK